jgi:hypothetical protein
MPTATTRAAIPYPVPADNNNVPQSLQDLAQRVDDIMPISVEGLISARPVTPPHREFYWASDDRGGKLYYGDGAQWWELGPAPWTGPTPASQTALLQAPGIMGTSDPVAKIRGKSGQTGDLLKLQDPTGATDLARVSSAGLITAAGGVDSTGSPSGTNGGEYRFPLTGTGLTSIVSTLSTGSPRMAFQHRATGNTGDFQWSNNTSGTTPLMTLSGAGILGFGQQPGATHEGNRADGTAQVYGRGFAYAADTVAHQGGVTAGLSVSVARSSPAAAISNSTGPMVQAYKGSSLVFEVTDVASKGVSVGGVSSLAGGGQLRVRPTANLGGSVVATWIEVAGGRTGDGMYQLGLRNFDNSVASWMIGQRDVDGHLSFAWEAGSGPSEMTKLFSDGTFQTIGQLNRFGRGGFGAANAYTTVGDDTNGALISAGHGTASTTNLTLKALGNGKTVIQSGSGVEVWAFDSSGNLVSSGAGGTAMTYSGSGLIALHNVGANPTTTPTAGGVLYASGGALRWRGSAGTDTQIAAA